YEGQVLVTIESTTVGATLRYTLDGTVPSVTNGIEIANGTAVQITGSATLKAIAYKNGLTPSEVSEAAYVITPARKGGGGGGGALAVQWLWLLAMATLARRMRR